MLFLEIVTELGEECDGKICRKITAGSDWEYKCMNHGNIKNNPNCCAIDYCVHTLDTTMPLLTNPIYFSESEHIRNRSGQTFPQMMRYVYRMLAYMYSHHRELFNLLEYRYRIAKLFTWYCKKFNIITNPKEYCIKI
jgi:hypothetical protein